MRLLGLLMICSMQQATSSQQDCMVLMQHWCVLANALPFVLVQA